MPAIVFNHVNAARWGATTLDRIYNGATLVWAKATGLPYTTTFPNSIVLDAEWSAAAGSWKMGTVGGQAGVMGNAVSPGVASLHHKTISAADVTMTARVTASGTGHYVGLMARVNGTTYYSGEYQDNPGINAAILRIVKTAAGTRTVLGTWGAAAAPTTSIVFKVSGTTLTITRGTISHSVTDTAITAPGGIGLMATLHQGFNNLTVTSP